MSMGGYWKHRDGGACRVYVLVFVFHFSRRFEPAMAQAVACTVTTGSALHLRSSNCSVVSCSSAPATAVPPSFLRPLQLQPAKAIRMRNALWSVPHSILWRNRVGEIREKDETGKMETRKA